MELIDRVPMIEPLKAAIQSTNNPMAIAMYNAVLAALERAPTVEPPVVHAYWHRDKQFGPECSNCNEPATYLWDREKYESNYCPMCGARMDAPERAEGSDA